MKRVVFFCMTAIFFMLQAQSQQAENWTKKELMEPSVLAASIKEGKKLPTIFSVGPGASIPHSIAIGMTNDKANVARLKKQLASLPKTSSVVVYCGCCPFEHCPNVRPAIAALKEAGFTNYKLLNIPSNLKKDWIDKGYPTVK